MKSSALAAVVLVSGFIGAVPGARATEPAPRQESPYFLVRGDAGLDQFPLKDTRVTARLNGVIASVHVRQVYRNQGAQPLNATYVFPGATGAAVHGMTLQIGERRIVAEIREKTVARKVFDEARGAGKSASLLSQQRPNVFSMDVANILPGDEVVIEMDYTEILAAEEGVYEFVYPGVVGPRYGGDGGATRQEVRWASNPYLHEGEADTAGFAIDVAMSSPVPVSDLRSTTHAIVPRWQGAGQVQVGVAEPAATAGNRDFILRYRLQGDAVLPGLTRFEQDGERYFMLLAEPPRRVVPADLPPRDYLFVIDVSGSMDGFPLATARGLMARLLAGLRPADTFNLLLFAGGSEVLSPDPVPATPENVARANALLAGRQGGGGTELVPALSRALAMPLSAGKSRSLVLITDGYVMAEDGAFREIAGRLEGSNLFTFGIGSSVNRFLIEGLARLGHAESFVVTDEAEAGAASERFLRYISAPVATGLRVTGRNVDLQAVEPADGSGALPDLLAERPILVLGKYSGDVADAAIVLEGVTGSGPRTWTFPLAAARQDPEIPRLWARKRLERLYVFPDAETECRDEILALGLRHSLLTSLTSFVAVDHVVRLPAGGAKDVKQPLPLPAGVSDTAVGGDLEPMPEPEWALLAGLGALGLAVRRRARRGPAPGSKEGRDRGR